MSYTDLVFEAPAGSGGTDLVFGDFGSAVSLASLDATIGPPSFIAQVVHLATITLSAAFDGPSFTGTVQYSTGTDRPTVATSRAAWEEAVPAEVGADARFESTLPRPAGASIAWEATTPLPTSVQASQQAAIRLRDSAQASWQDAARARTSARAPWQSMNRASRPATLAPWQNATRTPVTRAMPFDSALHDRRPALVGRWAGTTPLPRTQHQRIRVGEHRRLGWYDPWQEAMRPPAGTSIPTPPVVPDTRCYIPSADLVFEAGSNTSNTSLLFFCERHDSVPIGPNATIVVPIRKVYMVTNTTSLTRVVGNFSIHTFSLSLSLDVDSWAWGFSASIPANMLDAVSPTVAGPVELEALVNGTAFRLLVESISRERTFGNDGLRIGGRGKSALLAAPYAPIITQTNVGALTAAQVAEGLLQYNGVPLGWGIDWQIDDWNVPDAALQLQGSYMDGLIAVANAAGAYLRPHRTNQQISVLARYPTMPAGWSVLTPDIELPADVTTQESIVWTEKPAYNRVFVSGTNQGILGQVTVLGSAGDLVAPMVTDPLITGIPAARQRGKAILGNTGRQADVRWRLPVLPATGIIQPGTLVRLTEGASARVGLVRSVAVEAGFPETWQTIGVETHVS